VKSNQLAHTIKRPSFRMHITEAFRAMLDYRKSVDFLKSFKSYNKGDGHPVLVIPGFMGSNTSTRRLRKFIKKLGYLPYDWGLGRNYADIEDVDTLLNRIDEIYHKHQALIGWSLGGVYARELSKQRPNFIRQVITLGSPFAGITEPNNAVWLYEMLKGKSVKSLDLVWLESLPKPAPVPTTAVYSKEDGVVSWKVCLEKKEDEFHQNVEIKGSHTGLVNNASSWYLIADRLKYRQDNWKHFEYNGELKEFVDFPRYKYIVWSF